MSLAPPQQLHTPCIRMQSCHVAVLATHAGASQVKGDAFLARVFDDGADGFDRRDLTAAEVSSSAAWVKAAAAQNARKQQSGPPTALAELGQQQGQRSFPQPPAEQAKTLGNAAFKRGDFSQARAGTPSQ